MGETAPLVGMYARLEVRGLTRDLEIRSTNGLKTKAVMSVIRRHPVVPFLLAYALSWAAIPWQSFFAPGVLVAALVVMFLTEGVAGLRAIGSRLVRWRVSWVWNVLALALSLSASWHRSG
jgi:hypothetical protein